MPAESFDQIKSALAGRYTIERELGRGGNAVVYLAHDVKHDRKVALKVLLPELALAVRAERFLREIQIAAKLTHPNILPLFDSGRVGGRRPEQGEGSADGRIEDFLYYVMPYVEGESLRDRLKREKQLPVEAVLAIAREVADAVGHAHKQGVVHRDIKPENILLHEGHALVMDFGIARALTVAGGDGVTEAGIAVGTPAYMSPEQGAASGEVDTRSDIYSLGCVFYEMLAGHPPFTGATAQEILARHALDPVPSLRAARSALPESFERTVTRALAKQPADRFATAGEFATALSDVAQVQVTRSPPPQRSRRRIQYAAASLLALLATVVLWRWLFNPSVADRSIAIRTFTSIATDTAYDYLSDGITEELITALTRVAELKVFPIRGSVAAESKLPGLHVGRILEGSVRVDGTRLRVNAILLNTSDNSTLWSQSYDRELEDIFTVQEDLAREIVTTLRVKLGGSQAMALGVRPTRDDQAYREYIKGRFLLGKGTEEGVLSALDLFRKAIGRDTAFALAHAGLAGAYNILVGLRYMSREQALPLAKEAALRALALDSSSAAAHAGLGQIYEELERNNAAAEKEFLRAIALDSTNADGYFGYARNLYLRGRFAESIPQVLKASQIEPLSPAITAQVSRLYNAARDYDRTIQYALEALDLEPRSIQARQNLAEAYYFTGKEQQAIGEFQKLLEQLGGGGRTLPVLARLGCAYEKMGDKAEARNFLAQMDARSTDLGYAQNVAILLTALGEHDRAFQALNRAHEERDFALYNTIRWYPYFDPLRKDPRFKELLIKMGLESPA